MTSGAPKLQRGVVPPGPYANGARSQIVQVYLCAVCAGYAPITGPDYSGGLSGTCQGCGAGSREVHRFPALIESAWECTCHTQHQRVTSDLGPVPGHLTCDPGEAREAIRQAVAAERERLFVAIRHAIGLNVPWRGEALDLITEVWRQTPEETPDA